MNLLCGHSEPYSQTWPASGSMRSGRVWTRPQWAPATNAAASSSSPGLPTPRARDWKTGGKDGLHETLRMLPTPRASDGEKGVPNQRGSKGDLALSAAVAHLLPTPTATPYGNNQSPSPNAAVRPSLDSLVPKLLPTPRTSDSHGGGSTVTEDSTSVPRSASSLLPTPTANLATNGGTQHPAKRRAGGHQPSIADVIEHLGAATPPPSTGGNR